MTNYYECHVKYEKKPKAYIPKHDSSAVIASKVLQEFVINGEKIIAHSEKEAQKRYKARHK